MEGTNTVYKHCEEEHNLAGNCMCTHTHKIQPAIQNKAKFSLLCGWVLIELFFLALKKPLQNKIPGSKAFSSFFVLVAVFSSTTEKQILKTPILFVSTCNSMHDEQKTLWGLLLLTYWKHS